MKLSKNTWHYRVYRWWLLHKARSTNYSVSRWVKGDGESVSDYVEIKLEDATATELLNASKFMSQHNLCLYMRAVLFYALGRYIFLSPMPRIILANIIVFSLNIYLLLNLYGVFMSVMIEISTSVLILTAIGCLAGILVGSLYLTLQAFDKGKDTGFYKEVVKPYIKSTKSKICHQIEFDN